MKRGMKVDILVYDGNDELDVVGPLSVFANAGAHVKLKSRLVTLRPQSRVKGAHGLKFRPDAYLLEEGKGAKKFARRTDWPDVIVVPGGGWHDHQAKSGARIEAKLVELPTFLAIARRSVPIMAGVGSGVMLLVEGGVIGDRPATTDAPARADLAISGAQVRAARVVDDGDLVTCAGLTGGIDLALWLVEREFDRDLADQVATELDHTRWRPGD